MEHVQVFFMKRIVAMMIQWCRLYAREILLSCGALALCLLCFEMGYITGESHMSQPIVVEPVATSIAKTCDAVSVSNDATVRNGAAEQATAEQGVSAQGATQSLPVSTPKTQTEVSPPPSICAFIGSKNSTKYHASSCAVAKRIKAENKVCFVSPEDAQSKGYVEGCVQ